MQYPSTETAAKGSVVHGNGVGGVAIGTVWRVAMWTTIVAAGTETSATLTLLRVGEIAVA